MVVWSLGCLTSLGTKETGQTDGSNGTNAWPKISIYCSWITPRQIFFLLRLKSKVSWLVIGSCILKGRLFDWRNRKFCSLAKLFVYSMEWFSQRDHHVRSFWPWQWQWWYFEKILPIMHDGGYGYTLVLGEQRWVGNPNWWVAISRKRIDSEGNAGWEDADAFGL